MLQFLLGAAVIVGPPHMGLPLLGVTAAVKAVKHARGKADRAAPKPQAWNDLQLLSAGSVPPVTLRWKNITVTMTDKKRGTTKTLLSGVSGVARPGRLLAIMGPSGGGKTTLLSTLAGQLGSSKALSLTGELTVNRIPATDSNHRQAYVQQEDVFYSMLTVRETLSMAADLRLPPDMPAKERSAYVDRLMNTLGLTKVANTRVGSAKKRGLSGGEKKRLSLGCELVGSPSLLFLDEPTSGLDAAAAEKVMATLKSLAEAGHTVVVSVHQPRSSIWAMFDDLVLLNEGRLAYQGPANQALAHFAALGYACPPATNPAEFLADLISADYSGLPGGDGRVSNSGTLDARERVEQLVGTWAASPHPQGQPSGLGPGEEDAAVHAGAGDPPVPLVPWGQQFKLLARRSWRQVVRDKAATIARITANLSSAVVFSVIFWRLGKTQSNIQDRMGLMQVVAINTAMSSLSKTLNVFPRERMIVNRERAHHSYTTAPYLAGKLLAELPISAAFPLMFGVAVYPLCGLNPGIARFGKFLGIVTLASFASSAYGLMVGAFSPSTEAAMAIGPAAMTLWIVYGGYYVNADSVPRALRWLPKASLIKQAFSALIINELQGSTFEPDAQGRGMTTGQEVLDWLSLRNTRVKDAVVQQLRITAFYYWAAYAILVANKPRFQPLLPPRVSPQPSLGASGAPLPMQALPVATTTTTAAGAAQTTAGPATEPTTPTQAPGAAVPGASPAASTPAGGAAGGNSGSEMDSAGYVEVNAPTPEK